MGDVERGEVKLAGPGGRDRVIPDAVLFGSLAVHPSINRGAAPWTITHRATGCAIGYMPDEDEAIGAALDIEQLHPDALAELDRRKFAATYPTKRRSPAIKRLLQTLKEKGLR